MLLDSNLGISSSLQGTSKLSYRQTFVSPVPTTRYPGLDSMVVGYPDPDLVYHPRELGSRGSPSTLLLGGLVLF